MFLFLFDGVPDSRKEKERTSSESQRIRTCFQSFSRFWENDSDLRNCLRNFIQRKLDSFCSLFFGQTRCIGFGCSFLDFQRPSGEFGFSLWVLSQRSRTQGKWSSYHNAFYSRRNSRLQITQKIGSKKNKAAFPQDGKKYKNSTFSILRIESK